MRVIVLDEKGDDEQQFTGTFSNGVFKYKTGGILGLGASKKKMALNYKNFVRINLEKTGFVKWNGKDYDQLDPKQLVNGKWIISPDEIEEPADFKKQQKTMTLQDYVMESKLSDMMIDQQLTKPLDMSELVKWFMLVVLGLFMIVSYFEIKQLGSVSAIITKPLNISIQQNAALIKMLTNQTHQLYILYNRSYNGGGG